VEKTLAEYLSHVPVFVRKFDGTILHWTTGAEELYGLTAEEAVGRVSHELLQTVFQRNSPSWRHGCGRTSIGVGG
jgi:PAS domain-containing protein